MEVTSQLLCTITLPASPKMLSLQFSRYLGHQTAEIKSSSLLQMKRSQAYVPSTSFFHACINEISSFSRYGKNNIHNSKNVKEVCVREQDEAKFLKNS